MKYYVKYIYFSFNNFLYAALASGHLSNFVYNSASLISWNKNSLVNFSVNN